MGRTWYVIGSNLEVDAHDFQIHNWDWRKEGVSASVHSFDRRKGYDEIKDHG